MGDAFAAHLRTDNWAAETIERLAREGQVIRRDTLEQLAEACGILRPKALVNTLDRYNRDARAGHDGMFFKAAQLMRPVSQPPFYAVQMRCSVVALTFTGLRIDRDAQVISDDESPIPGLFAAGDAAGNVLGYRYVGGGTSLGNAIVFGQIAGVSAARFASGT